MLLGLSGELVNVLLLALSRGLVSGLQLLLQLVNLVDETVRVVFLHLGIFTQLCGGYGELFLEILTGLVGLPNHALVLLDVPLQVIEDSLLLLKSNKMVKFVLELDLLLFEQELEG